MGLADTSNGLFGTGVNIDVVERGLRRGLRTTTKCTGEKQVFRIGENQGFLSSVGVLRCNWSDATVDLPKEVVFKIATLTNTLSMKNRSKSVLNGSEVAKRNKLQWGAKERSLRKVIRALVAVQVAMHPCEGKERFNVNVYEELYSEMLQPTVLSFRLDELRSLDDSLGPLLADVDDHSKDCVSVKAFRTHHLEIGQVIRFSVLITLTHHFRQPPKLSVRPLFDFFPKTPTHACPPAPYRSSFCRGSSVACTADTNLPH
ncbi:unnamed protein product [Heligmosomoides polygyrus]|uniref:Uncharacterized protein n=1 Tax=Heligmosomoides polygyrus TaxID=6339 RepID=A0A3P8BEE4_HELPZ|nr:unnamed protein product [Heligmosomoides polygyrus]